MKPRSVLIAAFSGRALAQSARRAGYAPLVVDCFGDEDMRAAAAAAVRLPARLQVGFTRQPLMAALRSLSEEAETPPIGLVLGAGFECNPRLVDALAAAFPLLGNPAEVIRRVKDPTTFFGTLQSLGIRHPETRTTPPPSPDGWLMKRIGGSGGLHIHACPAAVEPDKRRYFQRRVEGPTLSVMGVASPRGTAFGLTRQWVQPRGRRPYRYGGAAGPLTADADLEARVIDAALAVERAFGLQGLVSFDFVLDNGEPLLVEVNPRPGASLDVLDDASGHLFKAHIACFEGGNPADVLEAGWQPRAAAASGYVYADRSAVTVGRIAWPDWVSDRPAEGTSIGRGQPAVTVHAEAETLDEAEYLCRERMGRIADMLYEASIGEKTAP